MEKIREVIKQAQENTRGLKISPNNDEEIPKPTLEDKLRRFNISSLGHTFEAFKPSKDTTEAVKTLKGIATGELDKQFVLLYGKAGTGKTHLIEAVIIEWAKRGIFCRYYTFSDIARSLKTALRLGGERYDVEFKRYCESKKLIIDDFGMGTTESKFEVADLEDIIDTRYRKRYYPNLGMTTIVATNKDVIELPERVLSRLCDPEFGVAVFMGENDYRRRHLKYVKDS